MKQKLRLVAFILILALNLAPTMPVLAATSKSKSSSATASSSEPPVPTENISSGVTQSYDASGSVKTGMLVMLDPKSSTTVIPLTQAKVKAVLGVVIPSGNATVVLTPSNASPSQVLVSTTGELATLVSSQNGPIAAGDYLSISSLSGIAMEASPTQSTVVGRAEEGFDGKTNVIGTMQVKNSLGNQVTVTIGAIPVQINVTHNPLFKKKTQSDYVPGFIGKIVFQVTSKNVSAARVYIAMVILVGLIILTANMLFGGLRGGMIAVGRQPLSKKSIMVSLIQTVFFAMAIFIGGIAGLYFFLKL